MEQTTQPSHSESDVVALAKDGEVPAAPSTRPRSKKSGPANATRRCVELTLRISAMGEPFRALLGAAVGCASKNIVDIATETVTHEKDVLATLSTLRDIGQADPMEAGILATVLSSEQKVLFKSAWRSLAQLPTGLPANPPAGSANAGLAFAKAAQALDDPSRKLLSRLLKDLGA